MSTESRAGNLATDGVTAPGPDSPALTGVHVAASWRAQAILVLLTLACLLPFSGKAFHIDDPIFLWTAQHVTKHPLDFYGFNATWWARETPMWYIQQNPPLAAYYMALVGSIGGWSERALHLGFLVPAVIVVLATYRLALRFTNHSFLASAASLAAPGFLVSATGLMCDVSMLALWLVALILWIKGLDEPGKPAYLLISSVLVAACALTKYFGISLIPLLFAYSWFRQRSFRRWILYLAIPIVILGAYELYTIHLYGHGLIALAALHKSYVRASETASGRALVGLVFAGGCTLPALTFAPLLWRLRQVLWGALAAGVLALSFWRGWIDLGSLYNNEEWLHYRLGHLSVQMFFLAAAGISLLALAITDLWRKKDAASLLLFLWVGGTIFFAVVINWDVNARSMLPMIPAVGILIARRIQEHDIALGSRSWFALAIPLIVSGAISLWVAAADTALANTARLAANYIHEKTKGDSHTVWFEGRWGFEYYMEQFGARPVEPEADQCKFGDLVVIPKYNTALFKFPLKTTQAEIVDFDVHTWVTAMNPDAGAGFYFSGWGPLPFVFGEVPAQRYLMARVLHNP